MKKEVPDQLDKVQMFFVAEKLRAGVSVAEIAEKLGVDVSVVENLQVVKKAETRTSKAFGRHPNRKGVVVMTPTASEMGDDRIKPHRPDQSTYIFHPKGDEE